LEAKARLLALFARHRDDASQRFLNHRYRDKPLY